MASGGPPLRDDSYDPSAKVANLRSGARFLASRRFPDFSEHTVYHPYHSMIDEFVPDAAVYDKLMAVTDINDLKNFIKDMYGKICGYDYLKAHLVRFLAANAPEYQLDEKSNPSLIITALYKYFDELKNKLKSLNLPFEELNILKGSELTKRADYFTKRILDEMEKNNMVIQAKADEIHRITMENNLLIEENNALKTEINILKGAHLIDDSVAEDFLAEMRAEMEEKDQLHSSLLGEVERERNLIDRLRNELAEYQMEIADIHQQNLQEVHQHIKDLELEGGIRRGILQKVQGRHPHPRLVYKAVNDWMGVIQQVIEEKHKEIEELKEMHIAVENELLSKQAIIEQLEEERFAVNMKLENDEKLLEKEYENQQEIAVEYEDLMETAEGIRNEIEQLKEQIKELDQEFITLSAEVERKRYEVNEQQQALESSGRSSSASGSSRSAGSPGLTDRSSSRSPTGLFQSPEFPRGIDSPDHFRSFAAPGLFGQSSPTSLVSSHSPGSSYSPLQNVSPPPSLYYSSPENISPPSIGRRSPAPLDSHLRPSSPLPGCSYSPLENVAPPPGFYYSTPENFSPRNLGRSVPTSLALSPSPLQPLGSPYSPLRKVTPPPGFYDSSPESISTPSPVPYSPTSLAPGSPYIPLVSVTPPTPLFFSSPESIASPSVPERVATVAPGTQTISRPQIIINPPTQTISGVSNRLDIGQGINMHTVTRGSPKPYHQVTKVDSKLPVPGTSRMADSSFSLKHTAELTPSQFVTPFISTTRFGYTDPTAKVLNLPPGKDLDIGTALKKTLLLTSPLREQPLLVNIDVDPKPLIRSASGEHFVCDISLDVQPSQEQQPVFSYGVPPAITPTTTRRHGLLHTPRGIFKKKHFNVRKLFEPGYISPETLSYHFPDSSSPLTGDFPPTPDWGDQTIPWEWEVGSMSGLHIMDRTFDAPGPSVMNRTFDAPGPSVMNRTFDAAGPSVINRTFDKCPSPGLGRSPSPVLGRTFDRSPSPVLDRTFDRSPPVLDRTFDRSPSPVLDSTYDRSSSPALGRSASPGLGRTFDRSPSPVLDRTYDRSPSPAFDRTYDSSPSPLIKRPVYADLSPYSSSGMSESPIIRPLYGRQSPYSSSGMSSTSPVIKRKIETSSPGGAYARSPSPLIKGKVYTYGVPPAITATTSRRHGPFTPRGIFKKDHYNVRRLFGPDYVSPEMPSICFHGSSSPLTGDFPPSPPYWGDQTIPWERSSDQDTLDEYLMDLTPDESPSPCYGRKYPAQSRASPSPLIKGPYYRYQSPASGGSLDRSASPVIQKRFHQSTSPGPSRMSDRSPSPIIKRPYYAIPSSDSSSGRSASPMINRTFGSSPGYDSSLSSSASPRLDPQQLNATFDRSTSPQLNRTSNRSESPQMNLTFDTSPPNPMDRASDSTASSQSATSPMTQQDRTFDSASSNQSGD